jgi:hypothetical protein
VDNLTTGPAFQVIRDTRAPTVTFVLPPNAPLQFTVAWFGDDRANDAGTPGSGIREYDVQSKVGGGSWQELLTDTTELNTPFSGDPGQTYYFRVQATDNVDNASGWVEAGPVEIKAVTKYYTHGGTRVAMRRGDEVRMRISTATIWGLLL